jgi:hypothetical protein
MPRPDRLSPSQASSRVYPEVGTVDTMNDVRELIKAVKSDRISETKKRQRLQLMYSLTFAKDFRNQFQGNIGEARSAFQNAYRRHMR